MMFGKSLRCGGELGIQIASKLYECGYQEPEIILLIRLNFLFVTIYGEFIA